ncbi:protein kinase superfamily protein [Artemisia annua]|uniref:Protein kinase superfamily protein n=1 Tax=Artemisia annua TaxID=35608 RepID=A0A2U1PSD3_ARTAN|nr:protein kinase superfamily protein [Artemisia annua]
MKEFNHQELEEATCNYSKSYLIGKGSHGSIYKATLKNGQVVAIKTPSLGLCKLQNTSKVENEARILSSISPNQFIVNLLGMSHDSTGHTILVMEHMPGGMLHNLLHLDNIGSPPPSWRKRAKMAIQIARAMDGGDESLDPTAVRDNHVTAVVDGDKTDPVVVYGEKKSDETYLAVVYGYSRRWLRVFQIWAGVGSGGVGFEVVVCDNEWFRGWWLMVTGYDGGAERTKGGMMIVVVMGVFDSHEQMTEGAKCTKGGKYTPQGIGKRKTKTVKTECPFRLVAKYHRTTNSWILRVKDDTHNHVMLDSLHGVPYAMRLENDELGLVDELTQYNVRPMNILSTIKGRNPDNVSSLRTIYNAQDKLRRARVGDRTTIQVLYSHLTDPGYTWYPRQTGDTEGKQTIRAEHAIQKKYKLYVAGEVKELMTPCKPVGWYSKDT